MIKTVNWSFNDLVRVGADDLLRGRKAESFQDAMRKAAHAILTVVREEFICQMPKNAEFDNAKFSIAVMDEIDTVIVGYAGHVFEVNQRPNMGATEAGFLGFALIGAGDERRTKYVDKLNRIKDKSNRLAEQIKEAREVYRKHAGTKEYLN